MYQSLVKEQELFNHIDAYITASLDKGLLVIEGKLAEDVDYETAEAAIWEELQILKDTLLTKEAVEKFHNRIEHNIEFSEMNNLHKAINLGYYELLGDAALINDEKAKYNAISAIDIQTRSRELFQESASNVLYYKAKDAEREAAE